MHTLHLTTKKFTLRPFRTTDAPNLVRWLNDSVIFENTLEIPKPYLLKHAKQFIEKNLRQYKQKKPVGIGYVIDIRGRAVGAVGFSFRGRKGEIGYWLAKPYRGKGIMSEALQLFVDHLFATYKLKKIEGFILVHNSASGRVLEKVGFRSEGILRRHVKKGEKLLDEEHYVLER